MLRSWVPFFGSLVSYFTILLSLFFSLVPLSSPDLGLAFPRRLFSAPALPGLAPAPPHPRPCVTPAPGAGEDIGGPSSRLALWSLSSCNTRRRVFCWSETRGFHLSIRTTNRKIVLYNRAEDDVSLQKISKFLV